MTNLPTLFQDSNLSGLPSSNPGSGKPWLDSSGVLIVGAFSGFAATWGSITGTLSSQTDLQTAFDGKQVKDATLTALAAVTTAADQVIYATGSDAFSTTSLTTFGRSLIDDADATTARTTLGLGTMATQASTSYAALAGATFVGGVSGTTAAWSTSVTVGGNVLMKAPSAVLQVRNSGDTAYSAINASDCRVNSISLYTTTALSTVAGTLAGSSGGGITLVNNQTTGDTYVGNSAAGNSAGHVYVQAAGANVIDVTSSGITIIQPLSISAASSTSTIRQQFQLVGAWVSSTDASRKAQATEFVYDTAARTVARNFADGARGYKALRVHTTAPADADMAVSEVVFYDNGSGSLNIKLKDAGGTVRTGTVTLS